MRAVIIGGNGFIGSHLVNRLLLENWDVVVYDPHPERYREPLRRVNYVYGKMHHAELLSNTLQGADLVFHLASTTIPQSSNKCPVFDVQSNLVGTLRLLAACVDAQISKIVFLSSGGTVYGIPGSLPVVETHPTNPICSYGVVKLAIEGYLHMHKYLYGLNYTILRPSNPFGPRQNPHGSQGAVAVFLGHLAQNTPVKIWGSGEIVRDYFYVGDLANACLTAATTSTSSAVFNVGKGEGRSLRELLTLLSSVTGRDLNVINLPTRSFDVPRLVLDVQRAGAELHWKASTPLEDAVALTWEWIQSLDFKSHD